MDTNRITITGDVKDGVIEAQTMWFFDNFLQALCRLDLETEEMDVIAIYEQEKFLAIWMYSIENKFYFTTNNSLKILVYDRMLKVFTLIKNKTNMGSKQTYSFWDNKTIWFIPQHSTEHLCKFEIEKMRFAHEENMFEKELSKTREEMAIMFPNVYEGCLYTSIQGKKIIKYDFRTDKMKDVLWEDNVHAVCKAQEGLWYTKNNNGNIYLWRDNIIKEIQTESEMTFAFLCNLEKYVIALPRHGCDIVMIEKESLRYWIYKVFEEKDEKNLSSRILNCTEDERYCYFIATNCDMLWKVDKKNHGIEIQRKKYRNIEDAIWKKMQRNKGGSMEVSIEDLYNYIALIQKLEIQDKNGFLGLGRSIFYKG